MKRQAKDQKTTYTKQVSGEGLLSRIYKRPLQFSNKETNYLNQKIGKKQERAFHQRYMSD